MPDIWEKRGGTTQGGDQKRSSKPYVVTGFTDDAAARAYAESAIPTEYDGNRRTTVTVKFIGMSVEYGGIHEATAEFERYIREDDERDFEIDTTGGMRHVTQALETVNTYKDSSYSGSTPDFKNGIGLTKDGLQGIEIYKPDFKFGNTIYIKPDELPANYFRTIYQATGAVNSADIEVEFLPGQAVTFAAGELLFLGSRISYRSKENVVVVSSQFKGEQNQTSIAVTSGLTISTKKGHHLIDFWYEEKDDSTNGFTVKIPMIARVLKVYPEIDLGAQLVL
jgi:hypothetical protein